MNIILIKVPSHGLQVEVDGTVSIAEAALDNDESEYIFHASAEGAGAAQDALSQAMQV